VLFTAAPPVAMHERSSSPAPRIELGFLKALGMPSSVKQRLLRIAVLKPSVQSRSGGMKLGNPKNEGLVP